MPVFAFAYFVFYILFAGSVAPRAGSGTAPGEVEAETMGNVGRISGVAHSGAAAVGRNQHAASGLARTPTPGITNDDRGAATIRGDARTQRAGGRRDIGGPDPAATSAQAMRDFVRAVRERIAELISLLEQISSFDGFPLGGREGMEQLNASAEFGLDQVRGVEQHVAETNAESELGIFSLARLREQAMRTLRCQDPEPDRVLVLLQDTLRADAQ